jgi:predicted homoserine dehydrogenase-like protein
MNARMLDLLEGRAASGNPLRVGLVGAGTFGAMMLSGARRLGPGVDVVGVADLRPERAVAALEAAGWDGPDASDRALDGLSALLDREPDVIVDATGSPNSGIDTAGRAIDQGIHVVMATVEADVVAGPLLAERARSAGVVYSLAYGDQPALVCELVDWARASGFQVVCAGKGTKYLPHFHAVTPESVWAEYGLTASQVQRGSYDARMFTSFLDGTKSALEMASIANATGLAPQASGLGFPACPVDELAATCIPRAAGGTLERDGTVEVVSSLSRDGSELANHLRWGVYVTFTSSDERLSDWLPAYGVATDASGRYGALWRPVHFIGLETMVSVLAAGLLGEATGAPRRFEADVVATAKRDLRAGAVLDGEGGFTVYGALVPAMRSIADGCLPIGLGRDVVLARAVSAGQHITYDDLVAPPTGPAADIRTRLLELDNRPAGVDR